MRINTNVSSLTAQEAAQNTGKRITTSLEKLSTGLRINKASDDASGLAIADKLRTQATSINQGISNRNSAVSLLQIADKSMAEQSNILDTIKSKLIQANTDTTSADGRESIRKDIKKLLEQLDNIAEQTNYNGNVLLQQSANDKSASNKLNFQIGETNRDMIENAAIQSNTTGLGSKVVYSATAGNNTISSGSTLTLASEGTINLTSTNSSKENVSETVSLSGDIDSLTLKAGMTVSNMDNSTKAAFEAKYTVGVDYTVSGSNYTMKSTFSTDTLDLSNITSTKTANVTTPSESATTLTTTVGDIIDTTGGTVTAGSDLAIALADTTKFESLGGNKYKALTSSETINLAAGESVNFMDATKVDIGAANLPSGSTLTLVNAVEAGSDLANQLTVAAGKFTYNAAASGGNAAGTAGAVYTINDNFTTDSLFVVGNEKVTITPAEKVTIPTSSITGGLDILDASITLNGNNVDYDEATGNVVSGATIQTAATPVDLKFTVDTTGTDGTFTVQAGDTINLNTSGGTLTAVKQSVLEDNSDKWVDNGDGTYTALQAQTLSLNNGDGDDLDVTRKVGTTETPITTTAAGSTVVNTALNTTDTISVSFTTNSKVDVTNNGLAANTLTISGSEEISNGGTQLSALADLDNGKLSQAKAAEFQSVIDDAITDLNAYRGDIGSTQNQVESAVRNLMTQATNVKAAESIIRDVDYAAESANFNKQNIISQAGSYAISQANAVQQNVLKLLQ